VRGTSREEGFEPEAAIQSSSMNHVSKKTAGLKKRVEEINTGPTSVKKQWKGRRNWGDPSPLT